MTNSHSPCSAASEVALRVARDFLRIHGEPKPATGNNLSFGHKARATIKHIADLLEQQNG